ncbi:MAG TPA: hypothetical protein VFA07_07935, partial [Chthonomonadaceae bacterium]|nr:hypothetical protein [Chthonomonadaceae bacterium]
FPAHAGRAQRQGNERNAQRREVIRYANAAGGAKFRCQKGPNWVVKIKRNGVEATTTFPPNEKGLAAMREIAERQKELRHTDDTNSLELLHKARAGAMYGYGPTE